MANYIRNVGKLSTDRYDFQDHIDGNPPHHKAGIITLDPAVTINSVSHTTVQGAITELAPFAVTVPDATESSKGIIQLHGDLSGTAEHVIASASKLQGYNIVATAPGASGKVLTWNGTYWGAAAVSTQIVIPAGDLSGTGSISTNPTISSLTGVGGLITVKGHEIYFDTGEAPLITQHTNEIDAPDMASTMTIKAQDSIHYWGGSLCLASGIGYYGAGDIFLKQNTKTAIHIVEQKLATDDGSGDGAVIIGLGGEITTTKMPINTGNGVIYIANAILNPTSGSPVGGTILYSSGGSLHMKESGGSSVPLKPTFSGDLAGTYASQTVTSITGSSGSVTVNCSGVYFGATTTPEFGQNYTDSTDGANMSFRAQTSFSGIGGNLFLSSGEGATKNGAVLIQQYDDTLIHVSQPIAGNAVIALGRQITGSQMPTGTGDKVIYIANADTVPTTGNPVGGTILYSSGGSLYMKQSSGVTESLAFVAGGDLAGTGSSAATPTISSLTGVDGLITVKGHEIYFDTGQAPLITQHLEEVAGTDGATFTIKAQDSTHYWGGNLCLASGGSQYSSYDSGAGDIFLKQYNKTIIHIAEQKLATDDGSGDGAVIIALGGEITTEKMPANTGNGVIYIADAVAIPTTGSPFSGTILYSHDGSLYVKQSSGQTSPLANSLVYFDMTAVAMPDPFVIYFFETSHKDTWEWVEPSFEINIATTSIANNDLIKVNFHGSIQNANVSWGGYIRLVMRTGSGFFTETAINGTEVYITPGTVVDPETLPISLSGVISAGTLTGSNIRIGVQLQNTSFFNAVRLWAGMSMTVEVIRPQW